MTRPAARTFHTPREDDLGSRRITNQAGVSISVLSNGCIFAIEHQNERGRTMINQVLGSPLEGGIARLYLRTGAPEAGITQTVGPGAKVRFGAGSDRFAWDGETKGVRHRAILWLHPQHNIWLWRLEVANARDVALPCDAILVQDVGLGGRGFLMNNEAYASQYLDHHVVEHPRFGAVVMSRQNLAQDGKHPWVAHGCLDGAASFATDARQLLGPEYRDAGDINLDIGTNLPAERLQHEVACPMIQSRIVMLQPSAQAAWTFFGLYEPDHAGASSDRDLARIDAAWQASQGFSGRDVPLSAPVRSVVQDAAPAIALPLSDDAVARHYPER